MSGASKRTEERSKPTAAFTDDTRSSEHLRSEDKLSDRLHAHIKVSAASISGRRLPKKKATEPDTDLAPTWRKVDPVPKPAQKGKSSAVKAADRNVDVLDAIQKLQHSDSIKKKADESNTNFAPTWRKVDPMSEPASKGTSPAVKAADRNVDVLDAALKQQRYDPVPPQLNQTQSSAPANNQLDAPAARASDLLEERGKASSSLSARPSQLTSAGTNLLRHGGGLADKVVYRAGQVNDLISSAAQDDSVAQGSAAGVRGMVQSAQTASAAIRASAWGAQAWLSAPFKLVQGAESLVSLVQARGVLHAVGDLLKRGGKFLLASVGSAIGSLALGILIPILIIAVIVMILCSTFGVGTDMSFGTADAATVAELYDYCTEKDAELTTEIHELLFADGYFSVQLTVNGSEVTDYDDFTIRTDIDQLLIYLQAVNADGTHTVEELKAQIDEIYAYLYTIDTAEHRSSNNAIAEAAVMVAAESTPARKGFQLPENNGTALYQQVHDLTQNNDLYQSCDRVACAIVRWSGADDNFPTGLGGMVYTYLRDDGQGTGRSKWMKLPDNWTRDDLQPGDVLIWKNHHHVFIYVGHELIEEKFPDLTDPAYCVVEGSYHTSYAACVVKWERQDYDSFVYRNIQPETNPRYVNGIPGVYPGRSVLDINVTTNSLTGWIDTHADDTNRQYMDLHQTFGAYAGYAIGSNPFGNGQRWTVGERYGAYADGTDIAYRRYVTVWTAPGRAIYSPINGLVTWDGNTVTIRDAWATERIGTVTIDGLSPAVTVGAVSPGDLVGTATGDTITIAYQIDGSYVNPAIYLANEPTSGSGQALVDMALTQLGQQGGNPYWSWYGFDSRVSWCACFVSWCADQCDLIASGTIPKFAVCADGVAWFQRNGQWQGRGYSPSPGDIIFFIDAGDTESHHTGIVVSCDGSTVQTVEGNSGDAVRRHSYSIDSAYILGYGVPSYS